MDLSHYQREAARTGGGDLEPGEFEKGLQCAALGLCGEAGEVADLVKKGIHHRHPMDAEWRAKMTKELGDVLWYLAHACNVLEITLDDVAAANVEKLRARYPEGFNTADSLTRRDLAAEGEVRSWTREDSHGAVQVTVRIPGEG